MAMCSRAAFHARRDGPYSFQFMRCLFSKVKDVKKEIEVSARQLKLDKESLTSTNYNMNMLKKKRSLTTKNGYVPPSNIKDIIRNVGSKYFGDEWNRVQLDDPICKFKVLSEIISQTNHDVPNAHLSDINNMSDVIEFFEEEVKETSVYEDLAAGKRAELPKNLSIQLEAHRFDPETDTMFGGQTAFPGSDTVVVNIKYRRKYKDIKTTKEKPGFSNYYYGY